MNRIICTSLIEDDPKGDQRGGECSVGRIGKFLWMIVWTWSSQLRSCWVSALLSLQREGDGTIALEEVQENATELGVEGGREGGEEGGGERRS